MTEHDHEHEHDHGHHHHGHGHGPEPVVLDSAVPQDAAAASLARALRMCFRFLTVILVGVIIAFAFTGLTTVNSDEQGVVTIFGRQAAVVGPGLHWTWPYPIGDTRKVSMAKQSLAVNFWPWLSEEDELKASKGDYSKILWMEKGLRPGIDGALLTGDEYLFHAKLQVMCEVEDPAAYMSGMIDPKEAVRTAVSSAAIRAAARRTAEGLTLGQEQTLFLTQVQADSQEILKKLGAGVRITAVTLADWKWPLRAQPDYLAAQTAGALRSKAVEGAVKEAKAIVGQAAGDASSRKLVGDPWREPDPNQAPPRPGRGLRPDRPVRASPRRRQLHRRPARGDPRPHRRRPSEPGHPGRRHQGLGRRRHAPRPDDGRRGRPGLHPRQDHPRI